MPELIEFKAIGKIHSPYGCRFGIPRQSGLVPSARFFLELFGGEETYHALRGIEEFSHLWVLFYFHDLKRQAWKPTVAPPRLGGKKHVGVFATRSPYRPNPIGMSVVRFIEVRNTEGGPLQLVVEGGDFQQDTPILDIKPYLRYADQPQGFRESWAEVSDAKLPVIFSQGSRNYLASLAGLESSALATLIAETLSLDPRPGYERGTASPPGSAYGAFILRHHVRWTVADGHCEVISVEPE